MKKVILAAFIAAFVFSGNLEAQTLVFPYNPQPATTATPSAAQPRRDAAVRKVKATAPPRPAEYNTTTATAAGDGTTTMTVNGAEKPRTVKKGRGAEGTGVFTPISALYYVQFAVYCKDTPIDKAPSVAGLFLVFHPGSKCPGGAQGAVYIVKGYPSEATARAAAKGFKTLGIDCFFNPALTGAEVEILAVKS